MAFYNDPHALNKLTPPPILTRIHRDNRRSLTEGELEFTLWFGPIPVRWIARHEPGPTETSFADRQIRGPLDAWHHEHVFSEAANGVAVADQITYTHGAGAWGVFTRLVFNPLMLRLLFLYRSLRTRWGVRRLAKQ